MDTGSDKDLYLHVNNNIVLRIKDNLTIEELEDSLTFIRSVLTPMIKSGTLGNNLPHRLPDGAFGTSSSQDNQFNYRGPYGSGNPFSGRSYRRGGDGYGDNAKGRRFRSGQGNFYANGERSRYGGLGSSPEKESRRASECGEWSGGSRSQPLDDQPATGSYGVAASGANRVPCGSMSMARGLNSFSLGLHSAEDQSKTVTAESGQINDDGDLANSRKRCRTDAVGDNSSAPPEKSTGPPSEEGDDLDWIPRAVLKIESHLIECSDSDD